MENIITQLFQEATHGVLLHSEQEIKMRMACQRAYNDNASYDEQLGAAKIYLKLIIDFPQMTL